MTAIIPFPKRTDPSSAQDFPTGRHVLAVYPGTTALYKATVVNGHRKVMIPSMHFDSLFIFSFVDSSPFCFVLVIMMWN